MSSAQHQVKFNYNKFSKLPGSFCHFMPYITDKPQNQILKQFHIFQTMHLQSFSSLTSFGTIECSRKEFGALWCITSKSSILRCSWTKSRTSVSCEVQKWRWCSCKIRSPWAHPHKGHHLTVFSNHNSDFTYHAMQRTKFLAVAKAEHRRIRS